MAPSDAGRGDLAAGGSGRPASPPAAAAVRLLNGGRSVSPGAWRSRRVVAGSRRPSAREGKAHITLKHLALAAAALALAVPAAADAADFTDPTGDNGPDADIGAVSVSSGADGSIHLELTIANMPAPMTPGSIFVGLDTDRNAGTGSAARARGPAGGNDVPPGRRADPALEPQVELVSSYRCLATLGGKPIRGTGRGGCTFELPRSAKRKRLVVTFFVTYRGNTGRFEPYVFRVR